MARELSRRRALAAGGSILAFGGTVAYVATRSGSTGRYVPSEAHTSEATTGFGVSLDGRPIAGSSDAPVDIYYWTDFLCPFCAKFEAETLPTIGTEYVDTGTARLVGLSYPNIGAYSDPAAVWSRCVWAQVAASEPTAYWRWHGAAFDEQSSGTEWADEETFADVTARTEGVPLAAVEDCRQSRTDALQASIDADVAAAQQSGIQGTPGFVIYNREADAAGTLVGAHPAENVADAIERVLAA
ncbi:DsbA family protein [Halococcoides cellulosivorans]|uniref:Disulfide bond formation protein DsbA n=1 Tax=Halococcoides cellulosivorans TaxID=1679096 RepID=A0A2R4WZP3_9EURY|nr:thioredoxin domain-containing protein [Halococcoides cellulosivorans]AWB26975.1 disulfide bond formation protein DsbA [Halococcoides cellulosivorans]